MSLMGYQSPAAGGADLVAEAGVRGSNEPPSPQRVASTANAAADAKAARLVVALTSPLWVIVAAAAGRGHLTLPARRAASLSFGEGRSRLGGRT